MRPRLLPQFALLTAAAMVLGPTPFAASEAPDKPATYTGKVVPLADVLAKSGVKMDKTTAARWLALATDDGKVYPLRNEDNGRMFYSDKALLNRTMRLTARTVDDSYLQVLQVHSIIRGELLEVYYWCDVCTIKRFEKKACECCGAPMELREEPVKK
jgi:hypothetical protein